MILNNWENDRIFWETGLVTHTQGLNESFWPVSQISGSPLAQIMFYLPLSFRVALLILEQSHNCPSASESTLNDMDKINLYLTRKKYTTKYIPSINCWNAPLTHWGRVTHICVNNLTIIGSDNGLSPNRRQAITWTNAGILFIGPLGTNLSEILIEILTFSSNKMRLKVSSAKRRPFCLGLNVLRVSHHLYSGITLSEI